MIGSRIRAIARLAASSSSLDIFSKSVFCSTSLAEKVITASIVISGSSSSWPPSPSPGTSICSCFRASEDFTLIAPVYEYGVECPVKIVAVVEPDRLHSLDTLDDLAGSDR